MKQKLKEILLCSRELEKFFKDKNVIINNTLQHNLNQYEKEVQKINHHYKVATKNLLNKYGINLKNELIINSCELQGKIQDLSHTKDQMLQKLEENFNKTNKTSLKQLNDLNMHWQQFNKQLRALKQKLNICKKKFFDNVDFNHQIDCLIAYARGYMKSPTEETFREYLNNLESLHPNQAHQVSL